MNNIKYYRNQVNISVYELAKKSNLTAGYISNLENNNKTNPSKEAMENISAALGKTVIEVFFSESKQTA